MTTPHGPSTPERARKSKAVNRYSSISAAKHSVSGALVSPAVYNQRLHMLLVSICTFLTSTVAPKPVEELTLPLCPSPQSHTTDRARPRAFYPASGHPQQTAVPSAPCGAALLRAAAASMTVVLTPRQSTRCSSTWLAVFSSYGHC